MATTRQNIFNFNCINTTLSKDTIQMLKNFYAYHHKNRDGYKKLYHNFQRKNLSCNIVAGNTILTSAVAGGINLNPIVLVTLTGFGLIVKEVASFKKYEKNKNKKPTSSELSTKKSPMPFSLISGSNITTKKTSSTG